MIKVSVFNNVERATTIVESSATLRQAFEAAGLPFESGVVSLNGVTQPNVDVTFESLGITDQCFLSAIKKLDNA